MTARFFDLVILFKVGSLMGFIAVGFLMMVAFLLFAFAWTSTKEKFDLWNMRWRMRPSDYLSQ